jgi:hypothetical protein
VRDEASPALPSGLGASPRLRYLVPRVPYGAAGVGPACASLSLRARRLTEIIGSLLPRRALTDSEQPDLARLA